MIKKLAKILLGRKIYQALGKKYYIFLLKRRNRDLYNNIKRNKQFYKMHKGKRCFILGNGPSLRDVNLGKLKDEYVFSVNCFARVQNFELAKPNYHLWMDYSFFELRDDQKYNHEELINDYYKMAGTGAICFVPDVAYSFIKENKIDKILDVHYLLSGESNAVIPEIKYKLDDFITGYSTVVQYAITVAIYMGFTEIYLLGCDSTSIISLLNNALDVKSNNIHAYDKDDTNERNKQILSNWSMTDIFFDQYTLFHGYKLLGEFSKKQGIVLRNCSTKTLINEISWVSLNDVLN